MGDGKFSYQLVENNFCPPPHASFSPFFSNKLVYIKSCIEINISVEDSEDYDGKFREILRNLIHALWLLEPASGACPSFRYSHEQNRKELKFYSGGDMGEFCGDELCINDRKDVEILKGYYNLISSPIGKDDRMVIIFNQMELAKHAAPLKFHAMKIINLITILETLFLPETEQELSFRLKIRATKLLGKTLQEREKIYSYIDAGYDLRSDIIHKGHIPILQDILKNKVGGKKVTCVESISKINEYVWKSVKLYLKRPLLFGKEYLKKIVLK